MRRQIDWWRLALLIGLLVLQLYLTLPGGAGLAGAAAWGVRLGSYGLMLLVVWPLLRRRWDEAQHRWALLAPLLSLAFLTALHLGMPLWVGAVVIAAGCVVALRAARRQWVRGGRLSKAKTFGLVYVGVALVFMAVSTLRSAFDSGDDGPKTVFITGLNRTIDPRQTISETCPEVTKFFGLDLDDSLDRAHGTVQYWNVDTPAHSRARS